MRSERRRELVSTKAQVRYRRLALLISYALGCAAAALAAGVQGNDVSWQRFTDGDPRILRAVATAMPAWENQESGWTGYVDGYATIDGVRYPFYSEPVDFDEDEEVEDVLGLEVWAVFDPDDLDSGLVVTHNRPDAESLLERPMVDLLSIGLLIAACCWAVQRLRVRSWKFPERHLDPIDETPAGLWWLLAIACVLWGLGIAWVAAVAADGEAHQPLLPDDPGMWGSVVVWMVCLLPAAYGFGRFFDAAATNPMTHSGGSAEIRPVRLRERKEVRATGSAREAKRRKDRRSRQRKRDRR